MIHATNAVCSRIAIITSINIIVIITTISRIAIITTINRIATVTTTNRIAIILREGGNGASVEVLQPFAGSEWPRLEGEAEG